MITGTNQSSVDNFLDELISLWVKNLGRARKFLGMRIQYDEETGYSFDQEVSIVDILKEHGLEMGHSVRVPITQDWNEIDESFIVPLPVSGGDGVVTIKSFSHSLEVYYGFRDAPGQISHSRCKRRQYGPIN